MVKTREMRGRFFTGIIIFLITFQALFLMLQCNRHEELKLAVTEDSFQPEVARALTDDQYAGTESCIECHEKEYDEWLGSHHDESMMVASDSSIKGDFNNITFYNQGVYTRFFKNGKKYMVNTEGKDGKYHDYEILYTFGTEPLQQYIVEFPRGRYQCLRIAWDTDSSKWFDLYPDLKIASSEWIHWTSGGMNWNTACADCHSTNLRKNYMNETDSFNTQYTIIDVSCEACHGPSKEHNKFVSSDQFDESEAYDAAAHLYMIRRDSSEQQVDQCARCHSRRVQFTEAYNHKGFFEDHYMAEILPDHLYFPDGQILEEDYVYSSFIQTKMYHNDVKCTNCHNPHTTKLKYEGNKLCLQCHEADKYDLYDHHFHQVDSTGSLCINCHMDGRYYMVNDYRRDHSFRVPRPDLSVEYGTPNACISCHTDSTNEWARDQVIAWYGPERVKNYADVLCLGNTRTEEAVSGLVKMISDTTQPAIARATAVWYLGFIDTDLSTRTIYSAIKDPAPQVRYVVAEVMQSFPGDIRYQYLAPLLKDPIRSVRVMALDALTDIPMTRFSKDLRNAYLKVLPEYKAMLDMRADFTGGQALIARYNERQGRIEAAEKALEKAIGFDTLFNIGRINLAHLYHNQGRNQEAIDLFKLVIKMEPGYGPGYYSLGLLYAETGEMKEAVQYLNKTIDVDPDNIRAYYNLGLAYQQSGASQKAESIFRRGLDIKNNDPDLTYALVILYVQQGAFQKADLLMPILKKAFPNEPEILQLEEHIRQGMMVN
jgi:predicted CXXCH cytochrome family protein